MKKQHRLLFLHFLLAGTLATSLPAFAALRGVGVGGETGWVLHNPFDKDLPGAVDVTNVGPSVSIRPTPGEQVKLTVLTPSRPRVTGAEQITLRLDLAGSKGLEVGLLLDDAQGEIFVLQRKPVVPGEAEIRWSFPGDVRFNQGTNPNKRVDGDLRLRGVFVERFQRDAGRESKLAVTALQISGGGVAAAKLADFPVEVVTGNELPYTRPADAAGVALRIRNPSPEQTELAVRVALTSAYADAADMSAARPVKLPAGGAAEVVLVDLLPASRDQGVYYVHWELVDEAGRKVNGRGSFVLMDPVGQTPGIDRNAFVFGIGGASREQNLPLVTRQKMYDAVALVGAESFRVSFPRGWRGAQPKAETPLDLSGLRSRFDEFEARGMEPMLLICYGGAEWTKTPEVLARAAAAKGSEAQQWRYPPRIEPWKQMLTTIGRELGDRVRFYEIWNEPDLHFFMGDAQDYFTLLKASREALRASDPDHVIITGGIAGMRLGDYNGDLHELFLRDGKDYFDEHGFHQHGLYPLFTEEMDRLVALRKKYGVSDKPLMFTETGMKAAPEQDQQQAGVLVKKFVRAWSIGAKGYYWFDVYGNSGYELLSGDWSPRPVWVAYNNLARLLRGRPDPTVIARGEPVRAVVYGGRGTFESGDGSTAVVCAWTEGDAADRALLLSAGGAKVAEVVDVYGNAMPAAMLDGAVLVTAREMPHFVVLHDGEGEVAVLGEVVTPGAAVSLALGVGTEAALVREVTVTLHNPLPRPISVEGEWRVGGTVRLADGAAATTVTLAPGESRKLAARLVRVPGDGEPTVTFGYRLSGADAASAVRGSIDAAVNLAQMIPATPLETRKPDFVLDDVRQLNNQMAADPTTQHRQWTGPADLSAEARLALVGDVLVVRFDVRDDRHAPADAAGRAYLGDGVQLGLAGPGWDRPTLIDLARGIGGGDKPALTVRRRGKPVDESALQLQTGREGDVTRYTLTMPLAAIGLDRAALADGLRFSFMVNDNDGEGRDGFLRLSENVSRPDRGGDDYPLVIFQAAAP